ncbi:MAG: DUF6431 domain-containing protein [Anaerovoracaceae bacterium]
MITIKCTSVNSINQKFYNDLTYDLNIASLTCPCCGHHNFVRHGYYERTLKFKENTIRLTVLRVRCKSCGSTHAILPECIVPYSQLSLDVHVTIITSKNIDEFRRYMESNTDLDESTFYCTRNRFKKHWKERLRSFGILITDTIVEKCFSCFSKQFMQIHCMRNILV